MEAHTFIRTRKQRAHAQERVKICGRKEGKCADRKRKSRGDKAKKKQKTKAIEQNGKATCQNTFRACKCEDETRVKHEILCRCAIILQDSQFLSQASAHRLGHLRVKGRLQSSFSLLSPFPSLQYFCSSRQKIYTSSPLRDRWFEV